MMFARIALFIQPFLFAANMISARYMAGEFPPIALAFFRWGFAFAILLPFIWRDLWQARQAIMRHWQQFTILGALGMGVCGAFVYVGAYSTSAINIGVIYTISPVFILLINRIFYRHKISHSQYIGILIALMGVLLVIGRGNIDNLLTLQFVIGDLWILAAAFGWAFYSIWNGSWALPISGLAKLGMVSFAGVLVLLPFTLFEALQGGMPIMDSHNLFMLVFMALVPSLGAYLLYSYITLHLGALIAGLTLYLSPIATALIGYFLLEGAIFPYHIYGTILVIFGIMLSQFSGKLKAK